MRFFWTCQKRLNTVKLNFSNIPSMRVTNPSPNFRIFHVGIVTNISTFHRISANSLNFITFFFQLDISNSAFHKRVSVLDSTNFSWTPRIRASKSLRYFYVIQYNNSHPNTTLLPHPALYFVP